MTVFTSDTDLTMQIIRAGVSTLLFLSVAGAGVAQEQPDTFRLRELVVTATRVPTAITAVPGAVTVLDRDELQQRGIRSVAEALRLVPGVSVMQSAGPGAQSSVFMRGGESDYVQVLVDGVQQNAPGGAFDWAHLRAEDVDRIEVVRGPASVLYGSNAVGGVVQIFTRAGGSPRLEAGVTATGGRRPVGSGTFTTQSYDATVSGAAPVAIPGGTLRYGLSAARISSNGLYELNNDYDNTNLSGRLQLAAARGDLALMARLTDHRYNYPTSGSGVVADSNQFATGEALSLSVDGGFRPAEALELRLLATSHRNDGRNENPPENAQDPTSSWNTDWIQRRKVDGRVNAFLPRALVFTAGVEREWQSGRTAIESHSSFGVYTDETDSERTNTGYYAQLHGTPVRGIAVTTGGRVDDNEAFGTFRTGRVGVSWTPVAGARVHGAFGTAFKEPTFFETYATGFTRGNPDLRPERARSWEVGAEYALLGGGLSLGATWFDQRFRNLIQYTAAPPTETAANYFNVGLARARGAELSVSGQTERVTARAAYTHTDTRVLDEGFGTDAAFQQQRRLLRRPPHQLRASLGLGITEAARGLLDVQYVGARDDLDFTDPANWAGHRVVLDGYALVDVGLAYAMNLRRASDVELTVRVRNVFDERYEEIYNFATPGRVIHVGVRAGTGLGGARGR